jgi:hypothetical protein
MRLNKVQRYFREILLDQPQALQNPDTVFARVFVPGGIALPERLKVYRNNVMGNLTNALRRQFPVTEKLVGEEFFAFMARSYILQNPPPEGCLNEYGADFDVFIQNFEPAKSLPYLPDVAKFETALHAAYHAADDEALQAEDLVTIAPESLQLTLRSSVRLIASDYPLTKIREFTLNADEGTLDISGGGEFLLIFRPGIKVEIVTIDAASFAMLELIAQGKALAEALETTLNTHPSFDFPGFLQEHVSRGMFRQTA